MTDVPLDFQGWTEPEPVEPAPDTGRGQLRLTDVDRKLAGWTCEEQITI